jgi:hypothetical protein
VAMAEQLTAVVLTTVPQAAMAVALVAALTAVVQTVVAGAQTAAAAAETRTQRSWRRC